MTSFLDGVGVLVICLGYTFPLAIEFQKKKEVSKVNAASPALFKHTDHGERFFYSEHVDSGLKVITGAHIIHIMVKLLNGAMLQYTVKNAEQYGVVRKKSFCIPAFAVGNTADEVFSSFRHGFVFLDFVSHIEIIDFLTAKLQW